MMTVLTTTVVMVVFVVSVLLVILVLQVDVIWEGDGMKYVKVTNNVRVSCVVEELFLEKVKDVGTVKGLIHIVNHVNHVGILVLVVFMIG
jgi:hypothetical protein